MKRIALLLAVLAVVIVGCTHVDLIPFVLSVGADGDTPPFEVTLEVKNPKLNKNGQPVGVYQWSGHWEGEINTGSIPYVKATVPEDAESPILFAFNWTDGEESQCGHVLFEFEEAEQEDQTWWRNPCPCPDTPQYPWFWGGGNPCPNPCPPEPGPCPCPPEWEDPCFWGDPCNPMPPCVTWETWIIEVQVPVCQYPLYKIVVDCDGGYLYWDPYMETWRYPWEVEG